MEKAVFNSTAEIESITQRTLQAFDLVSMVFFMTATNLQDAGKWLGCERGSRKRMD